MSKLIHMVGKKQDFTGVTDRPANDCTIAERQSNYNDLLSWLKKAGGDSKWHLRAEYKNDEYKQDLLKRLNETSAHLWLLQKGGQDIGFAQTLENKDLTANFNDQSGNALHFYKFGLLPAHRHSGLGAFYASSVVDKMFETHEKVYLNTRSSNAVQAVNFWGKFGFEVVKEEDIEDIFVPGEPDI